MLLLTDKFTDNDIKNLTKLEILIIDSNKITNEGIKNLIKLEFLDLGYNTKIYITYDIIKNLPKLQYIKYCNILFEKNKFKNLFKMIKKLKFDIKYNSEILKTRSV